jgi:hypothetical protein
VKIFTKDYGKRMQIVYGMKNKMKCLNLGGTMTVRWTFEMEHYKKEKFTQNVDAALLHFKHNHAKEILVSGSSCAHGKFHNKPSSLESEFNASFGC